MQPRSRRLHLDELEDRAVPSSPGDIEWLQQFASFQPGFLLSRATAADPDGNVYVAGSVTGSLSGQPYAGETDAFVRKYDAAGTELWTRQFGTARSDQALGVAVEASGVYVVGYTDAVNTSPGDLANAFVRRYDADGNELWTRQISTTATDQAFGVAVDSSGVYVSGFTSGTLPGQTSAGGNDVFVRKYDVAGTEQWTRQFGTAGADLANGVSVDASGVYVAGNAGGALPGQIVIGSDDAFLRKYDLAGNEVWTRQFGSTTGDGATSVAVHGADVYVVGVQGFVRIGSSFQFFEAFVRKYDVAAGTLLWTREFGTPGVDGCSGVAVDDSGIYVTGQVQGALPGQTYGGFVDSFVRRYDTAGNVVWTRQFATDRQTIAEGIAVSASGVSVAFWANQGGAGLERGFVRRFDAGGAELWTRQLASILSGASDAARAVDAHSNVYVAGSVGAALPGQTSAGLDDGFVRKYDAAGNLVWSRQFGTTGTDSIFGIAVDASGLYVAGFINGVLPGQTGTGSFDAFVRKYDAAGNELWTRQFGTAGSDQALGLAADVSGVYVAGLTSGTFPGQASAGGFDVFVRKYDGGGAELWTRQFGSTGFDTAFDVAVDGATGVYVAGNAGMDLPGQTAIGGGDAFVRKYDPNGAELWTRQYGTADSDGANGIAADASGVYVTGDTFGAFPGQTSAGSRDAYLRKYDPAGNQLWARQFGSLTFDGSIGVAVGSTGVYVAGFVNSALPGQTHAGNSDAFLRKYNAGGTELWTHQFGTPASDVAAGVAVSDSGLYVVGSTGGAFPGQTNGGVGDVFVTKLVDGGSVNSPPSDLALSLDAAIEENSTLTLTGSFADPDAGDTHTVVIDWGPGEGTTTLSLEPGATTFTATHPYLDDNPSGTGSDMYPVSVTVSDTSAGTSGTAELTVNNAPPAVTITGPASGSVYPIGTPITFTGTFTDAGTLDTHTAQWTFEGVTITGSVTQGAGSGTVSDSYTFTTPGVYSVRLTVTDDDGGAGTATTVTGLEALVVVYDPSAGFVTGGGWIDSPAGAYATDPALTGRANFGFVSKYQHGATVPEGQTEFQFKAGGLNFHSTAYDWLVVAGARAQFKGTGTINGAGNYGFKMTAIDGQFPGGGDQDKFRIKIWDKTDGDAVVYDNQIGAADGADPTIVLGGGSIVIHSDNLLADEVGRLGQAGGESLTASDVQPLLTATRSRWLAAGEDVSTLRGVDVRIADLDDTALGLTAGGTIWLDRNAAGWGWFVDPTPRDDSEFTTPGDQGEQNRMDLLTVLMHEMGHVLGHEHETEGVMAETLTAGERRGPDARALLDLPVPVGPATPPAMFTLPPAFGSTTATAGVKDEGWHRDKAARHTAGLKRIEDLRSRSGLSDRSLLSAAGHVWAILTGKDDPESVDQLKGFPDDWRTDD